MKIDQQYRDQFLLHYMVAAITLMDEEHPELSLEDIHPEAKEKMREDCENFINANAADLQGMDPQQAGCDFWLTRNGHGAGYWDRDLEEVGERLSAACGHGTPFPQVDLYVGDDGKAYL